MQAPRRKSRSYRKAACVPGQTCPLYLVPQMLVRRGQQNRLFEIAPITGSVIRLFLIKHGSTMFALPKQIFAYSALLLLLGCLLSTLVYIKGSEITSAATTMAEEELPLIENISRLRFAIFAQKPILYEYYANTDKEYFRKKFADSKNVIKAGLYSIPRNDQSQSFLTQIELLTREISEQADRLDLTLKAAPIDWDLAREILVDVSVTERKITPLFDSFVALNHQQVTNTKDMVNARMNIIVGLVIGFSFIFFLGAIWVGKKVNSHLAQ
jgi:hypothetical protein